MYPTPLGQNFQNHARSEDEETITRFHRETAHIDPNAGNDKMSSQTPQNIFAKMVELEKGEVGKL